MTIEQDRAGHVAIIVTAREYQALVAASALYEVTYLENDEPAPADIRRDARALSTLRSKCRDAGIRYTLPESA